MLIQGLIVLAVVFVLSMGSKSVRRIWGQLAFAALAQFGYGARRIAKADPVKNLEQKIETSVVHLGEAIKAAAQAKTHVLEATRLYLGQAKEVTQLENRIQAAVANGDPNESMKANAVALVSARQTLARYKERKDARENTYNTFRERVATFQIEITEARQRAKELGTELKMRESEAAFVQQTTNLDQFALGDTLAEYENEVRQRIESFEAQSAVHDDLSPKRLENERDDELFRNSEADKILQEFQAKRLESNVNNS